MSGLLDILPPDSDFLRFEAFFNGYLVSVLPLSGRIVHKFLEITKKGTLPSLND
mgnify:CR=1 FL=1